MVYGIDACRGGWVCCGVGMGGGAARSLPSFQVFPSFAECLTGTEEALVVVDIPIGLLQQARPGGRGCDQQARDALGWPRRNSVFSPPARPALYATEYRKAIQLNGQGLSKQAFGIIPKIREVDEAIAPSDQRGVFEGHPEMAFMRLAGAAVREPKRKPAGRSLRAKLLEIEFGTQLDLPEIRSRLGRALLAYDDILDAAVLALTARRIADGAVERKSSTERDARGFEMAIWY